MQKQTTDALVEAEIGFVLQDRLLAVEEALVVAQHRFNYHTRIQVVHQRSCALNVKPVQDCLDRIQQRASDQVRRDQAHDLVVGFISAVLLHIVLTSQTTDGEVRRLVDERDGYEVQGEIANGRRYQQIDRN